MTNDQLTDEELQTLIIELQQTAYRLNGTNSAYLMSDAIKPLRELQERRKTETDSKLVAWGLFDFSNGALYNFCSSKNKAEQYQNQVHQSSDSLTLEIKPLYAATLKASCSAQ
ncbi:hypothetical protein QFL30_003567 [Klebsiella oxytoca]|nr:hypothetical protein [Klebsiella oxytoca]